jgi:hypothetical protein
MALATSSVEALPPSPRRVRVAAATGHVVGAVSADWEIRWRSLQYSEQVKAKEAAVGVTDISRMPESQAVTALRDKLAKSEFIPREAAALCLVDRIIVDPHSVDDALFAELRKKHLAPRQIQYARRVRSQTASKRSRSSCTSHHPSR